MKQEGFNSISIIYLTLDGRDPSSYSIGSLKGEAENLINPFAYKEEIIDWLEACIKLDFIHVSYCGSA